MTGIRKRHSKETKVKIVLAALAGEEALTQIAQEAGVHPTQIKDWKAQALEAMSERFSGQRGRKKDVLPDARLYEEIGRLKVDLDFLSGKLGR